ncbi:unnamed protein product [Agarophyton chilense]
MMAVGGGSNAEAHSDGGRDECAPSPAPSPAPSAECSAPSPSSVPSLIPSPAPPSPRQRVAEQRERKRQARKRARQASRQRRQPNTSVYITGLPADATASELAAFCAKCGILLPDARTGAPRVKIYYDEHGAAKGDALVTYALRPSVDNALLLLDGACLRAHQFPLSVVEASFDHKKARTLADAARQDAARAKSPTPRISRHLFVREKMSWADEQHDERNAPNACRIVILKNVFDANTANAADYDLIREDMQHGCAECGQVDKVSVFERSVEGAVAVKFNSIQACLQCIQVMNARWYDGRQLSAQLYDGKTDYRYKETDVDREKRDIEWKQWLEDNEAQDEKQTHSPQQQNKASSQ